MPFNVCYVIESVWGLDITSYTSYIQNMFSMATWTSILPVNKWAWLKILRMRIVQHPLPKILDDIGHVANIDHLWYGAIAIVAARQAWQLHAEKSLQSVLCSILCTNDV